MSEFELSREETEEIDAKVGRIHSQFRAIEDEMTTLLERVKEMEHQAEMSEEQQPISGNGEVVPVQENWMSKNGFDMLRAYAGPPKSLTATITTEEGHTYKGVLYLVKEQEDEQNV